jgi:hypothetical protein
MLIVMKNRRKIFEKRLNVILLHSLIISYVNLHEGEINGKYFE